MKPAMIPALVAAALCSAAVSAGEKPPSADAVGAVYSLDTGKVEWLPESPAKAMARLEALRESVQCLRSH